jgi:5'(3')-deoxyribonucleotidase
LELDGQKNIIEDDGMIENGVKVIELKGDRQMVKQNKPKNSNSFLKYRLQEFKDYIR